MKLAVVSALWRRPDLTRLFLQHTASLRVPGVEIICVAAVSPEDPEPSRDRSWYFAEADNEPLSDKFNDAMDLAGEFAPDKVLLLGSDDFVNAKYIEIACGIDADIVEPRAIWFFDRPTKRAMYARCSRIGAGRVLSKGLMDKVRWRPWEGGYDKGLETSMDRHLRTKPVGIEDLDSQDAFLCDVKTPENLWSYDYLKHLDHEEVDAKVTLENYVPEIAGDLYA